MPWGRVTGSFSLVRLSLRRSRDVFKRLRLSTLLNAAVRYRRFPLVSTGAALLGVAATALPPLLIAQLYGTKTLGWFALGDRVLGAPTILIGTAVSQVYWVEAGVSSTLRPQGYARPVRSLHPASPVAWSCSTCDFPFVFTGPV